MNNYFKLPTEDKRMVLQQTAANYGLPPQAIEKDIWVTTILQIVFSLPIAESLIFKGGTSLSKVWGLIERFSEDIDLAVDRTLFGLEGDLTKRQIKKLRKASSVFVRENFSTQLQTAIEQYGLAAECSIEVQPDGAGDGTYPEALSLFFMPPSIEALRERLGGRATDDIDTINQRVDKAAFELIFAPQYDVNIVNDDLDKAVAKTREVIESFISK